jgi:hypothetical protein
MVIYYYSDYSIIAPNYLNNEIINSDIPERTDDDRQTIDIIREHHHTQTLHDINGLLFIDKCAKIFTRINKYIFKKEIENNFNMHQVCENILNMYQILIQLILIQWIQ